MSQSSVEKVPVVVHSAPAEVSRAVAAEIAALVRARAAAGRACVLGLATGSTPVGVYDELARLHAAEGLSFANVVTFNLDEYYPMARASLQSYHRFMREHLFDRVDVPAAQVHIPDGTRAGGPGGRLLRRTTSGGSPPPAGSTCSCWAIGRTGHVGFNEPGSGPDSRTRLITLDRRHPARRRQRLLRGQQYVPRRAITMGVGTILAARRVVMVAFGEGKAGSSPRPSRGRSHGGRGRQLPPGPPRRDRVPGRGGRRRA